VVAAADSTQTRQPEHAREFHVDFTQHVRHRTQIQAVNPPAVVPIIASGQWDSADTDIVDERVQIYASPGGEDYLYDTGYVGAGVKNFRRDDNAFYVGTWPPPQVDWRDRHEPEGLREFHVIFTQRNIYRTQIQAVSPEAVVSIIASGQWNWSRGHVHEERVRVFADRGEQDYLFDTGPVGLGLQNLGQGGKTANWTLRQPPAPV
jgi:hypothetical protein